MSHDLIQMRLLFQLEQDLEVCCDIHIGDSPFVTWQVKRKLVEVG